MQVLVLISVMVVSCLVRQPKSEDKWGGRVAREVGKKGLKGAAKSADEIAVAVRRAVGSLAPISTDGMQLHKTALANALGNPSSKGLHAQHLLAQMEILTLQARRIDNLGKPTVKFDLDAYAKSNYLSDASRARLESLFGKKFTADDVLNTIESDHSMIEGFLQRGIATGQVGRESIDAFNNRIFNLEDDLVGLIQATSQ